MKAQTGKMRRRGRGGLVRDRRGAVLAEFAVAIMPLLLGFFVFFQVAVMVVAKMFVRHATICAARAGIVIKGGGATNPMMDGEEQGTDADIDNAFLGGLGMWGENGMLAGSVTVTDPGDVNGPVVATSNVTFTCTVPLGKTFVCPGGTLAMTDTATLPKQGAEYK